MVRENRYHLDIARKRWVIERTHQRWVQTNPHINDVGMWVVNNRDH
jgi:hypothetical protein